MNHNLSLQIINNYKFLEIIGEGSYGIVYKVKSLKYDLFFAAKVIHNKNLFNFELNALIKLDHPNIIRIYDYFILENYNIFILEYCSGMSLYEEILLNSFLEEKKFLYLSRNIVKAIKHIHKKGFFHGDIKPQNILLDNFRRPKITDFGLSQEHNNFEKKTIIHGTIPFIAPEILFQNCNDYFLADIWSLGVTFYFLLTGNLPFNIKNMDNLKNKDLFSNLEIPNRINFQIKKLLILMLTVDPLKRPNIQKVNDIIENLELENIQSKSTSLTHKKIINKRIKTTSIIPFIKKEKKLKIEIIN